MENKEEKVYFGRSIYIKKEQVSIPSDFQLETQLEKEKVLFKFNQPVALPFSDSESREYLSCLVSNSFKYIMLSSLAELVHQLLHATLPTFFDYHRYSGLRSNCFYVKSIMDAADITKEELEQTDTFKEESYEKDLQEINLMKTHKALKNREEQKITFLHCQEERTLAQLDLIIYSKEHLRPRFEHGEIFPPTIEKGWLRGYVKLPGEVHDEVEGNKYESPVLAAIMRALMHKKEITFRNCSDSFVDYNENLGVHLCIHNPEIERMKKAIECAGEVADFFDQNKTTLQGVASYVQGLWLIKEGKENIFNQRILTRYEKAKERAPTLPDLESLMVDHLNKVIEQNLKETSKLLVPLYSEFPREIKGYASKT